MAFDYYEYKFKQWGKWATPRLEMDYPCITTSIPVPSPQGKLEGKMGDDEAMAIHDCLMTMRQVKPILYDVFLMTYAYKMPKFNEYDKDRILVRKGICDVLEIGEKTYRILKNEAKSALSIALVCMNVLDIP